VDDHTLRLTCLKIARPDGVMNPDAKQIIERANAFYQFVTQATEADKAQAPAESLSAGRRPRQGK
jgi:hypothetical protein